MSAKKTGMDYINATKKEWAEWRLKNNKPSPIDEPSEVLRVREIASAMESMRWKDESTEGATSALSLAVCDDRWDLIKKAASLIERDYLPRNDPRRLKEDAKWIAYCLGQMEVPKLSKRQILKYIEKVHSEIFKTIDQNDMRGFWGEVDPSKKIPQDRGCSTQKSRYAFAELVAHAILNKRAGFPDFLGHRDNPNWK